MNRRRFIKSLAVASTVAPSIAVAAAAQEVSAPIYAYVIKDNVCSPNPEWFTAPYEIAYIPYLQGVKYRPLRFRNLASAQYYMKVYATETKD